MAMMDDIVDQSFKSLEGPVFGTMNDDRISNAIRVATKAGYRTFDFAERYKSQDVAYGALYEDNKREDLYLISKFDGLMVGEYDDIRERVATMLETAGTKYFDLLLIHYPLASGADLSEIPSNLITPSSWEYFSSNIAQTWKHMTALLNEGLVRNVGVSNFYEQHMKLLLQAIEESKETEFPLAPVAASQFFIDAAHPEYDLVQFCQERHIQVMAYRPLAFIQVYTFLEKVTEDLHTLALEHGFVDVHGLILGWLRSRNIVTVCSSTNSEHIQKNFQAATFEPTKQLNANMLDPIMAEHVEMIDMYGGLDEYAAEFKKMNS